MARRQRAKIPENVAQALTELKAALVELHGDRLRGVYLFGSYARGDFHEDSDVDVLIVLAGEVCPHAEINRSSEVVAEICLRNDVVIADVPVAEDRFKRRQEPLLENAAREGIPI